MGGHDRVWGWLLNNRGAMRATQGRTQEALEEQRRAIAAKECYCTNEVFLWPSIVYRPPQLVKLMLRAKPWANVPGLEVNAAPAPAVGGPPAAGMNG